MGEDMTYATELTRAQLAARVAEANQYALAMEQDAEALRQRVAELERENAELRARLDAVPVDAMGTIMEVADIPFGYLAERNTIHSFLNEAGWKP